MIILPHHTSLVFQMFHSKISCFNSFIEFCSPKNYIHIFKLSNKKMSCLFEMNFHSSGDLELFKFIKEHVTVKNCLINLRSLETIMISQKYIRLLNTFVYGFRSGENQFQQVSTFTCTVLKIL